jgi:hypothetical protein
MSRNRIRALLVVVALVVCAAVGTGSAAAKVGGAQLAVIATRGPKAPQELRVFGPRGQSFPPIAGWALPIWAEQLAWSPDGREFAFVAPVFEETVLGVARADGTGFGNISLSPESGAAPLFGPEGDLIVPTLQGFPLEGGGETFGTELLAAPTDGSGSRSITSFGPGVTVHPYSIAADGTVAAEASDYAKGKSGIATFKLGSSELRWLPGTGKGTVLDPAISPDGSRIAFLRDRSVGESPHGPILAGTELVVAPVGGGRPRRLAKVPGGARWPSWDPSGSRISFTVLGSRPEEAGPNPGRHSALMEMNADGSCLTTVFKARHGGAVWGGAWRPGPGRAAGPISC